ncbi:hypothetical protein Droror1_Dr00014979 [Drosera rotundifolia]
MEFFLSGFNSTLRQGNITHHEYIQVGKGRVVGLNQIAVFEGKVAGGEQVLSRDVYRLGQLFDFFRMMSCYFTTVGYYFCTMSFVQLTVLAVYLFLYGKTYLALSEVGETLEERADILGNTALAAALNAQFLLQIGIFTAAPMVLGFILEQGLFSWTQTFKWEAARKFRLLSSRRRCSQLHFSPSNTAASNHLTPHRFTFPSPPRPRLLESEVYF